MRIFKKAWVSLAIIGLTACGGGLADTSSVELATHTEVVSTINDYLVPGVDVVIKHSEPVVEDVEVVEDAPPVDEEPVAEVVEQVEPVGPVIEEVAEEVEPVAEVVEPVVEVIVPIAEVIEPVVEVIEPIAPEPDPAAEELPSPVIEPVPTTTVPRVSLPYCGAGGQELVDVCGGFTNFSPYVEYGFATTYAIHWEMGGFQLPTTSGSVIEVQGVGSFRVTGIFATLSFNYNTVDDLPYGSAPVFFQTCLNGDNNTMIFIGAEFIG